jgi:hypothetical protein
MNRTGKIPDGRITRQEDTMDPEQIGLTVGLVVAASLALQTALGPAMASICEAIKATKRAPEGYGGVISLALGTGLGTVAGLLACAQSQQFTPLWIGVGAFAGLIGLGAGGVRSHLVAQGYQQQMAWNDSKQKEGLTLLDTSKKAA